MNLYTQDHPMVITSVPRRASTADTSGSSPHIGPALLNNGENQHVGRKNVQIAVPGWPTLATLMADKPDLQAFCSFADLNIKSLLYYQAELIHLRKQLHKAEWKDHYDGNDTAAKYAEDLESLFMMVADPDEKTPEQWAIMCKIREVLDKYKSATFRGTDRCGWRGLTGDGSKVWGDPFECSIAEKTLSGLILNFFTGLFVFPNLPPRLCVNEFQQKLIVPSSGRELDGLTRWIVHSVVPLYIRLWQVYKNQIRGRFSSWLRSSRNRMDEEKESAERATNHAIRSTITTTNSLTEYSGSWIIRIISIVTTVMACLLPTVAIIILARVRTIGITLGLIALFTAMFALGLVLVSSGRSRMQIFTATAVFPALMVVFVQNQLTPGGQGVQVQ